AAEESHLHVLGEAMKAEEPDLVLDAIEGGVPFDRLPHAGDGARDERVEAAPDVAFPARHGRDVGLHGGVAVTLRDLRVAAREKGRLRRHPLGGGFLRDLGRLRRRRFNHYVHSTRQPADVNLPAPGPAPASQRTAATPTWRRRR